MTDKSRRASAALMATTAILLLQAAPAAAAKAQLGNVHFETSCSPAAQKAFDRAMTYQHSFWYSAASQAFNEVLNRDPGCAMAYWGIAQALRFNPYSPPPAKNLVDGLAAVEKGRSVGAKTQRERDYIEAIAAFYVDHDKRDHAARLQAHLQAMETLAQRYPKDDEAQIYYALALAVAAPPADKTYANQLKAAAILGDVFKRQPQHPGVAHYLIHSYDYPAIADKGIDSAKRYAKIAPAAPHAQHMPSHIFTRVGHWDESVAANQRSAKSAKANQEFDDMLHAQDYMVYAYLQRGQDRKAHAVITEMMTVTRYNPDRFSSPYALAASPARYMIERGDWNGATNLPAQTSKFAYADAITYFARALGHARLGKPEAAKGDIAKLAELRDQLLQQRNAYWAEQVDIQHQVASAWALHAEGKHDAALTAMAAAAAAEDRTEKHVVTPGPLAPARELYGEMLLERGNAKEALAAFEATLKKEPNRLRATFGAMKAADKAGDKVKAGQYRAKAAALTAGAQSDRRELADLANGAAKKKS